MDARFLTKNVQCLVRHVCFLTLLSKILNSIVHMFELKFCWRKTERERRWRNKLTIKRKEGNIYSSKEYGEEE